MIHEVRSFFLFLTKYEVSKVQALFWKDNGLVWSEQPKNSSRFKTTTTIF